MDTTLEFPAPKAPARIEFPQFLTDWMRDRSSEDPWLAGTLAELRDWDEPWTAAVAAGHFIRLRKLSRDQRDLSIQRALAGEEDPDSAAPRVWAQSLSEDQLDTLDSSAVATVNMLHDWLEELESDMWEGIVWQRKLRSLLTWRDDLESVRLVLKGTRIGDNLGDLVEGLDDTLRNSVEALPAFELYPEQLERSRWCCWWADISD